MYMQSKKTMPGALVGGASSAGQVSHDSGPTSSALVHFKTNRMARLIKTSIKCAPPCLKVAPTVISSILMAFACPATVAAQQAPASPPATTTTSATPPPSRSSATTMKQVVVTGTLIPTNPDAAAVPVTTLDASTSQ